MNQPSTFVASWMDSWMDDWAGYAMVGEFVAMVVKRWDVDVPEILPYLTDNWRVLNLLS